MDSLSKAKEDADSASNESAEAAADAD